MMFGWVGGADGKIFLLTDFDGTFVNDQGDKAGWVSYWRLKRIERRHISVQPDPRAPFPVDGGSINLPEYIDVSYAEYLRLRPYLGKDEAMIGSLVPMELDVDPVRDDRPQVIVPGYYRLSEDLSFERFRPKHGRGSYLLDDYRAARKRSELTRGRLNWRGPAMALVRARLADPSEVDGLIISTYRGNDVEEFQALLEAMQKDGEVAHAVGRNAFGERTRARVHALSSSGGDLMNGRDLVTKKQEVTYAEARNIIGGPWEKHVELVPNQAGAARGETAMMHTLIIAEEEPRLAAALYKKQQYWLSTEPDFAHHIKLVFFNCGPDEDIATLDDPLRWTVFDRGLPRPATYEEIQLWAGTKSQVTCTRLLAGEPTEAPKKKRK